MVLRPRTARPSRLQAAQGESARTRTAPSRANHRVTRAPGRPYRRLEKPRSAIAKKKVMNGAALSEGGAFDLRAPVQAALPRPPARSKRGQQKSRAAPSARN